MKYIVTEQGPIDRNEPGTDVTAIYSPLVRDRLVKEGYVVVVDETTPVEGSPHDSE